MESNDLTSSSSDPLEAALRHSPLDEIPDAGFSARVVASLPPPRSASRPSSQLRRLLLIVAGATAGYLFAAKSTPEWSLASWYSDWESLVTSAMLAITSSSTEFELPPSQTLWSFAIAAAAIIFAFAHGAAQPRKSAQ